MIEKRLHHPNQQTPLDTLTQANETTFSAEATTCQRQHCPALTVQGLTESSPTGILVCQGNFATCPRLRLAA